MDQSTRPDRATPLQSVWSMVSSAMMVECEQFIYLVYTFQFSEHAFSIFLIHSIESNDVPLQKSVTFACHCTVLTTAVAAFLVHFLLGST